MKEDQKMYDANIRIENMGHITKTEALLEIAKAINNLARAVDGINGPNVVDDDYYDDEPVEF